MSDETGKEPGGWELYRGIERIEAALHENNRNAVSQAVFAVEKQRLDNRIDVIGLGISSLDAKMLLQERSVKDQLKEQDAQKGRNRLFVYGIIGAPVAAFVVNYFLTNPGTNPLG